MLPSSKKKVRLFIYVFSSLFFLIFIFIKIDRDIKPVLFSISSAEVRIKATESINKIVKEELSKNIKYSDFVSVKTDINGDISAIEMNTVEMNKFGASVALKAQEEMKFIGGKGVSIPLGTVTGSSLLSYFGPKINVKVMPVGNVTTDFKSEIESAGINQSRYRVFIVVNTNLQILIPLGQEKVNVVTSIPIAETLIVGKVPNTYFNTQSGSNIPQIFPIPSDQTK